MKSNIENNCMVCRVELAGKKIYPVYSSTLVVTGYRCAQCHEMQKTPGAKMREEEISKLTKEVPKLENIHLNIKKGFGKKES